VGSDYTIVMWVRHRFGDTQPDADETDVDFNAPFVGRVGEFEFSCPNVDSSQGAVLEFQYRGSNQYLTFPDPQAPGLVGSTPEYPVAINGRELAGGVPAAPSRDGMPQWGNRLLLIEPGVLAEQNVLRIESTDAGSQWWAGDNLDNFTIDNVVVFFKVRAADGKTQPLPVGQIAN
jgi:hypothetical protein